MLRKFDECPSLCPNMKQGSKYVIFYLHTRNAHATVQRSREIKTGVQKLSQIITVLYLMNVSIMFWVSFFT